MTQKPDEPPFFIGWATADRRFWPFLGLAALALFAISFTFAYMVSATQDDPGEGGRMGQAQAIGIIEANPYPMLHILESEQFAEGRTILLMGQGKNGVQERAENLDGVVVNAAGARLNRGDLDGMILRGGMNGLAANTDFVSAEMPEPQDLGRWRLTGEMCDGNCLAGAMRPGTGLAHRACANLCILGGLPPVFVATDTVEGSEFFLMANADGGPLPMEMLDYTALLIRAEGQVERRGGMNVFLMDTDTVEVVR
ncbi:MAG: hypothetical protein AAF968_26000 [Pseudomonadota bacterium]